MARRASRRNALEEAIRLRDEAAQLYVKLDGLVQSLTADEAAAQRGGHDPLAQLHPGGERQNGSVPESVVLRRFAIVDERTGKRRLSSVQPTVEGAAKRDLGTRVDSSTRAKRPQVRHPAGDPPSPANDESSEG